MIKTIMIIEDERQIAELLNHFIQEHIGGGVVTDIVETAGEAKAKLIKYTPDAILLDLCLPDSQDGVNTYKRIRADTPAPIIILTGDNSLQTKSEILNLEPLSYLDKTDIEAKTIVQVIKSTINLNQAHKRFHSGIESIKNSISLSLKLV